MRNTLEAINSPGGHIGVCLLLFAVGVGLRVYGFPWAADIVIASQSAAFMAMNLSKHDGEAGGK